MVKFHASTEEKSVKPKMANLIPATVCALIFASIIILVQGYTQEGKQLLLIVSSLGLILACILVVGEMRSKRKQDSLQREEAVVEENRYSVSINRFVVTSAWIVGIFPLVYLVGFTVGISFYVFIYCRLHGGRWLSSITLGIVMATVVYLGFVIVLQVRFPRPILLPFLRW